MVRPVLSFAIAGCLGRFAQSSSLWGSVTDVQGATIPDAGISNTGEVAGAKRDQNNISFDGIVESGGVADLRRFLGGGGCPRPAVCVALRVLAATERKPSDR